MLRLEGVSHAYDGRRVLHGIDLELPEHRIGVIGANGSGKSTLARTLNGLVLPDEGRVWLGEWNTHRHARQIRRRVGFVFSDAANQDHHAHGRRGRGGRTAPTETGPGRDRTPGRRILNATGSPATAITPRTCSGGQRQMLALASVLATEPEVLVCDEPTTLLDLRNSRLVHRVLSTLDQRVVLFTHDLDLLAGFDRVLVMDGGRVVHDGTPAGAIDFYTRLMDAAADDPAAPDTPDLPGGRT